MVIKKSKKAKSFIFHALLVILLSLSLSVCSNIDKKDSAGGGCPVPDAPTGVSATDGTYSNRVVVSWNSAAGATGYNVYRSTSISDYGSEIKDTSSTSHTDYSVTTGTMYYYRVKAYNSCGMSVYSSYDPGYPIVPYPNLSINSLSSPQIGFGSDYGATDFFSLAVVFENDGSGDASSFRIGVYLSTDTTWDGGDTLIAITSISSLSAGYYSITSGQITLPSGIPYGNYYVLAIIDDQNSVSETNEYDNGVYFGTVRINSQVTSQVDLVSFNFDTSSVHTVASGGNMWMYFAALNNSAKDLYGVSYMSFYLSTNNIISTADDLLGRAWFDFSTSPLLAMYYASISGTVTLPSKSPGLYYLGGYADDEYDVPEYSNNNTTHDLPVVIY